jgi:uncharacterized repeat protein (TIGR01451 family)
MKIAATIAAILAVTFVLGCGPAPIDVSIAIIHNSVFTGGQNGTYSITVSDVGANATTGVITVTDVLPTGLTYVSATGTSWSCAVSGQTVTCTNPGPIAGGGAAGTITLIVGVASTLSGSLSNTATVSTPGDTNSSNNSSTDTMTVNAATAPKLAITKTHTGNFSQGQNGVFTIAISNTGNASTNGTITATDTLPTGMTFVSGTGSNWSCSAVVQIVTCTDLGSIAPSAAAANITLTVAVASNAPATIMNTAAVTSTGSPTVSSTDTVTVNAVIAPDLAITKSVSGGFTAGANGIFNIAVNNTGSGATTGVITVTDTLNSNFSFVSGVGTGWTCGAVLQVVTCTNPGPIAGGASAGTIAITVGINGAATGAVSNTATVSDPGDSSDVADKTSTISPTVLAISGTGIVRGGSAAVSGATVQLYAVGTTGDGSASTPLLTSTVRTNSSGQFSINGLYTCPSPNTLVYLTATGGNPGLSAGTNNPALALMTALGPCSSLSASTPIYVNELTTVASVSTLQLYMQDLADIGSGSSGAESLAAAFATVNEFVNTTNGTAPGPALPAGEDASTQKLNLLANALASCTGTAGGIAGDGSPCGTLFADATPPSPSLPTASALTNNSLHPEPAVAPTNAAGAVLNIAKNPANNIGAFLALGSSAGPYQPALTSPPVNLTPTINFTTSNALIQANVVTPASNGVLTIPLAQAPQAKTFTIDANNSGLQDFSSVTVSTSTGSNASLPVSVTICQVNTKTAECLAAPATSVQVSPFAPGAAPVFLVFVNASTVIANDPVANRIYVLFTDSGGTIQGSVSVAVVTSN